MNFRKLLLSVSIILAIIGCSTTPVSEAPIDASIPELRFQYLQNGGYVTAYGQGAAYFNVGDPKSFIIQVQDNSGDCLFTYDDGNSHFTQGCKGQSTIQVNLGNYTADQPSVIGFAVALKNLGTQIGYFYPNIGTALTPVAVTATCPYVNTNSNLTVCTRPATYDFNMAVNIPTVGPGQLLYRYRCGANAAVDQVVTFTGPFQQTFLLASDTPAYCAVGFAVLQNPISTLSLQKLNIHAVLDKTVVPAGFQNTEESFLFTRFYDPKYVPLALPVITQTADGWQACAGEDYNAYTLNGVDHGSISEGHCVSVTGPSIEFDAWDSLGRFTWNVNPGRLVLLRTAQNLLTAFGGFNVPTNGYIFYDESRAYALKYMSQFCSSTDIACFQAHQAGLLQDPKMIQAVEAWNANLLYQ